jgi:hypothetical protein
MAAVQLSKVTLVKKTDQASLVRFIAPLYWLLGTF